ncbi:hypothetical protein [uncultured Rummeliibacillus sp.]|nr:hypothetical protein [uncultured Rummeliibacillus sp.]
MRYTSPFGFASHINEQYRQASCHSILNASYHSLISDVLHFSGV